MLTVEMRLKSTVKLREYSIIKGQDSDQIFINAYTNPNTLRMKAQRFYLSKIISYHPLSIKSERKTTTGGRAFVSRSTVYEAVSL